MRIRTLKALGFACALLAFAAPAGAQGSNGLEVSAGANIMNIYEETAFGVNVDLAKMLRPMGTSLNMGVVGDLGINWFEGDSQLSLAGGPRFSTTNTQIPIHFQVLVGILNGFGSTDVLVMPGAGVKFTVSENTTVKVQADVPIDFYEAKTYTGLRLAAAIVWLLGQ